MKVFSVDTHLDDPGVHSMHFCHPCQLVIHKCLAAGKEYCHKTASLVTGVSTFRAAAQSVTITWGCSGEEDHTNVYAPDAHQKLVRGTALSIACERDRSRTITVSIVHHLQLWWASSSRSLQAPVSNLLWLSVCSSWACDLWVYCVCTMLLYMVKAQRWVEMPFLLQLSHLRLQHH